MKRFFSISTAFIAASLSLSAQNNPDRMIIVQTGTNFYVSTDINEFSKVADMASSIGATHIECSQVEPSMWQWSDRYDPYPCWSMQRATLFKFVVPDALKQYIPVDYAKRNMDALRQRSAIMKKKGLKGSFILMDPAYLPEQAYLDHPEWRGPRCDQARRARFEYYAPCIDNPQMRKMFVDAFTQVCKVIPVEMVSILCNDSGAGLCWYQHLYPGANGPESCRHISVGDRALSFLSMWQEGAAAAGVNVNVDLGHTYDLENIIPRLKPGQSLNNKTASGSAGFVNIGLSGWYNDGFSPAYLMPRVALAAQQLQKAQESSAHMRIHFRGPEEVDLYRLLKMYLHKPIGKGPAARYEALTEVAATFVGKDHAPDLVQIWENIEQVATWIKPYSTGGTIYELGTMHQRWLTRPFVAFPEELKGDDFHYWRDFLFQAQTEKEAMDMTDLQAHKWLGGYGGYFSLNSSSKLMQGVISPTIRLASSLQKYAVDKESGTYLKGLVLKLRLFSCIVNNGINAVEFQWIMDESAKTASHEDNTLKIRWQGDDELVRMNQITRNEIDNCLAIIRILDEAEAEGISVIVKVNKKEFEQVLYFGPDIKEQLRHKIAIMEEHRRDFLRIWRSKNL